MNALQLLTTRSSTPILNAPAPSAEHWQMIQQAAVRVPDHAGLNPWQFIVFRTEQAKAALGDMFAEATKQADPSVTEIKLNKLRHKPNRAPLVVVCIARHKPHAKVPRIEQLLSAGCSVMAMQQAAFALGYGGVWRTGAIAHNPHMKPLLGLAQEDEVVGYLYLGTPARTTVIKSEKPYQDHFIEYGSL